MAAGMAAGMAAEQRVMVLAVNNGKTFLKEILHALRVIGEGLLEAIARRDAEAVVRRNRSV